MSPGRTTAILAGRLLSLPADSDIKSCIVCQVHRDRLLPDLLRLIVNDSSCHTAHCSFSKVTDHGNSRNVTGDTGVVWLEAAVLGDVIKGTPVFGNR